MPSLRTLPSDLRVFAKYHLRRRVYDHPAREVELGVQSLEFDLDSYIEELRALGSPFSVETLIEIDYRGGEESLPARGYPVLAIRSSTLLEQPRSKTVLVLAGVHGNEHAGLLAVPPILKRFAGLETSVRLVVVTPANPVGAAELSRYNGEGFDINRDFVRFDTREAQVIREVIERERPSFIVSLHEGPQDASFMFANHCVPAELGHQLTRALANGGTTLATHDYFGMKLSRPGYSPASLGSRLLTAAWARTLKMKTTGRYAEELGIGEITLESSWRETNAEARIRPHVDLVVALCQLLDP